MSLSSLNGLNTEVQDSTVLTISQTSPTVGKKSEVEVVGQTVFSGISNQAAVEDIKKYRIGEILGSGGFSLIFLAKKGALELTVLKITEFKDREGSPILGVFYKKQHKASLMAQNIPPHPLIMRTHKSFLSFQKVSVLSRCFSEKGLTNNAAYFFGHHTTLDGFYFEECEYLPGKELFETIAKGGLSGDQVQFILASVVSMLKHLQRHGIAHRDLKSENIVFDERKNLKLVDFGLAKKFEQGEILRTTTCCGSPNYAAPELFMKGDHAVFPPDIWALGVIVYSSIAETFPFPGEEAPEIARLVLCSEANYSYPCFQGDPNSVTVRIKNSIQGMLQKKPNRRLTVNGLENHEALNELNEGTNWELFEKGSFISPFLSEESSTYSDLISKGVMPWEDRTIVMPSDY
jgi:serine/threonine protein kinase